MLHKAEWMGYPMRLELTGLLVKLVNHYTTQDAHAAIAVQELSSYLYDRSPVATTLYELPTLQIDLN